MIDPAEETIENRRLALWLKYKYDWLLEDDMEKRYFYYLRDDNNKPIVTVCLIKTGDIVTKGIAICSERDNPVKKVGRNIAAGRAVKAQLYGMDTLPVSERGLEQYGQVYESDVEELTPMYKSVFTPYLSDYEKEITGQ
jgi:hypothetical protein